MNTHSRQYSITFLIVCLTVVAGCLGAVVSPSMWTTSFMGATRMMLFLIALIIVLNRRRKSPRLPVAYLGSSIAYGLTDPWRSDAEIIRWSMEILDRLGDGQAMVGVWHLWSLIWILLGTLVLTVLLRPEPLNWQVDSTAGRSVSREC